MKMSRLLRLRTAVLSSRLSLLSFVGAATALWRGHEHSEAVDDYLCAVLAKLFNHSLRPFKDSKSKMGPLRVRRLEGSISARRCHFSSTRQSLLLSDVCALC